MGFLKKLKAQYDAAQVMATQMAEASSALQASMPQAGASGPPTILDPTPQDEVDRLLREGGVARGVVMGSRDDMSDGDRPVRTRVHVRVRARLADGALGDEVQLKAWVGWKVAALLSPGLEIPVEIDRATMRPTAIDTKALAAELKHRSAEAKDRQRGWDFDTGLEGIRDAPALARDLLTPDKDRPEDDLPRS